MAGRGRTNDVVTIIYPPGCREVNYYQYQKKSINISNIRPKLENWQDIGLSFDFR